MSLYTNHELELNKYPSIINKNVFNVYGDDMGTICDVDLDDKYKINNLLTNKNEAIQCKNISRIENILICSDEFVNFNKYKKRVKINRNLQNIKVEILHTPPPKLPTKAIINEKLLLNRVVYNTILDHNNQVLIKSNTMVNDNVIALAKENNKLKDLIRYSF